MAGRKRRKARRVAARWSATWSRAAGVPATIGRAVAARLRPWRPAVEVDVAGKRGRRLRRRVSRVARSHLKALRVAPPAHLVVVVQRSVALEGRPHASLLQMFEGEEGPTRHVLFLAASAGDRALGDGEIVGALRHQLQRVVAPELGPQGTTAAVPVAGRAETPPAPEAPEPPGTTPLDELASTAAGFGGLNGGLPVPADR